MAVAARLGRTGTKADFSFRTVGVRRVGADAPGGRHDPPLRLHRPQPPSQSISSDAKTGPSRQTRCGVPDGRHDDAAEAGPDGAAHPLLHRHLEERLPARGGRAGRVRLPGAALPAELRDAEPAPPRRGEAGEGAEHRLGAAGERLVRPGLVLLDELGDEPLVPHRAVVRRDDVLDLVGKERRRVDVAGAGGPEQERHLASVADRLVGEAADAGDAEATGDQEQVLAPRIHLERAAQRTEHVDACRPAGGG